MKSSDIHKNENVKTQARNILGKHKYITYKRQHYIHGYHRLAIHDDSLDGSQPFYNSTTNLMCNGEIYNYNTLKSNHNLTGLTSKSDTEIILPFYNKQGIQKVLEQTRGEFSFIITENINQ